MQDYMKPFPIYYSFDLHCDAHAPTALPNFAKEDFIIIFHFLRPYHHNNRLFTVYCREIEHFLRWVWLIAKKSILYLKYGDVQKYITFRLDPPVSWTSSRKSIRFIKQEEVWVPNPHWRPFRVKAAKNKYQLSQKGIKNVFNILSKVYDYLLLKRKVPDNSIALAFAKQKIKHVIRQKLQDKIKLLTEIQRRYLINTAMQLADKDPSHHETTLFIITLLYLHYPRPYELLARNNWTPQMNHFYQDSNQNWWFKILDVKNKVRDIAVSDDMLNALQRYRQSRGLNSLPLPNDFTPLLVKRGGGVITYIEELTKNVQYCFNKAIVQLQKNNLVIEANAMKQATIYWLRCTGIADDINKRGRPIDHVRDDAGYRSNAAMRRFLDVDLKEQYESAKRGRSKKKS